MTAVDSSAVVGVMFDEPQADEIELVLLGERCAMTSATRVELGIVVESRVGPVGAQLLEELLDRVEIDIIPVDEQLATEALRAWRRFGKGRHPAGLNYGDAFSYALAVTRGEPLLFVGDDFGHTDVESALG